jgi:hypothetical protein
MYLVMKILLFIVGAYFFVSGVISILGFDGGQNENTNNSEDDYLKYWIRRYYGGMSGIGGGAALIALAIILYLAQ